MTLGRIVGVLVVGALSVCCQCAKGPADGSQSAGGSDTGGDPYVLFPDRDGGPRGMALNSTHVFWPEGGQIWRGLKMGEGTPEALSNSGRNARSKILAVDEERVYFVNGETLAIMSVDGGEVQTVPLGGDYTFAEILHDADAVFLVDQECRKIARVSKSTLEVNAIEVKEMLGLPPKLAGAAGHDSENVYCGTGRHLTVLAYDKRTAETTVLFDGNGDVRVSRKDAFSGVATTSDAYYWMADDAYAVPRSRHELWRLPRGSSEAEKIFEVEVTGQLSQLLYDDQRNNLYWNTGESILEYDIATGEHRLLTDTRWMGGGEAMDDAAVYWADQFAIGRVLKTD